MKNEENKNYDINITPIIENEAKAAKPSKN